MFLNKNISCQVVDKGVCISQGWVQAEITPKIQFRVNLVHLRTL